MNVYVVLAEEKRDGGQYVVTLIGVYKTEKRATAIASQVGGWVQEAEVQGDGNAESVQG